MPKVDLPLDQRNIIITRSKEGILDIKKIFISKGANVFDLPAISIGDPDDLNPLDEALNQINDFHWIIFSSSNGIKFCLLYTSPSPRDTPISRMPSSA